MKRSEMKRRITNLLKTWEGSQLNGETSEELLQLIESLGMLPPMLPIPEYTFQSEHKWEPENE